MMLRLSKNEQDLANAVWALAQYVRELVVALRENTDIPHAREVE